jgi:hypothetical protein
MRATTKAAASPFGIQRSAVVDVENRNSEPTVRGIRRFLGSIAGWKKGQPY